MIIDQNNFFNQSQDFVLIYGIFYASVVLCVYIQHVQFDLACSKYQEHCFKGPVLGHLNVYEKDR